MYYKTAAYEGICVEVEKNPPQHCFFLLSNYPEVQKAFMTIPLDIIFNDFCI